MYNAALFLLASHLSSLQASKLIEVDFSSFVCPGAILYSGNSILILFKNLLCPLSPCKSLCSEISNGRSCPNSKLYALIMCNSLYINYTLRKLFFKGSWPCLSSHGNWQHVTYTGQIKFFSRKF